MIQLDGKLSPKAEGARWIRSYPREITGIIISRTVRQLHLLAGAIGRTEQLASVAILQLHFASGQTVELPLRYGEDIAAADDSFYRSPRLFPVAHARSSYKTREVSYSLHHVCLVNPRPEDRIETIDFVSGVTTSHPYILAITLEQ